MAEHGGRRAADLPPPPTGPEFGADGDEQPPGDPETVARLICLRMLERRARSRAELLTALLRRGVPDDAANRVLDRFTEVGLIDDSALAQSIAGAQHRERGLARRAVAHKLRQRGIDDDTASSAVAVIDSASERARARQLVERRQRTLATLPTEVQIRRLVALLARKGYPAGVAYEVVRDAMSAVARLDDAQHLPESQEFDG